MIYCITIPIVTTNVPQELDYLTGKLKSGILQLETPAANVGNVNLAVRGSNLATGSNLLYPIVAGAIRYFRMERIDGLWVSGTAGDSLYLFAEVEEE